MSDTSTPDSRASAPALVGVVSGLAVVLVALTAVAVVVALVRQPKDEALKDARAAALTAGKQVVINLDALNSKTLDADLKRIEPAITGTFKTQFLKDASTFRDYYPKRNVVSHGVIRGAAVVKGDLNSMTLLIASDRTVTDVDHTKPVLQISRYILAMEKHGGKWLVADLDTVP